MDISDKLATTASLLFAATLVAGFTGGITLGLTDGESLIGKWVLGVATVFAVFALGLGVAGVWSAQ